MRELCAPKTRDDNDAEKKECSNRDLTELSIHTAPSSPSVIALACSKAKSPETAKNITSHSRALATSNNSTFTLPYFSVSTVDPALRALPKMRSFSTGKLRVSKHCRISLPTAPVAPTIPTVNADMLKAVGAARKLVDGV